MRSIRSVSSVQPTGLLSLESNHRASRSGFTCFTIGVLRQSLCHDRITSELGSKQAGEHSPIFGLLVHGFRVHHRLPNRICILARDWLCRLLFTISESHVAIFIQTCEFAPFSTDAVGSLQLYIGSPACLEPVIGCLPPFFPVGPDRSDHRQETTRPPV